MNLCVMDNMFVTRKLVKYFANTFFIIIPPSRRSSPEITCVHTLHVYADSYRTTNQLLYLWLQLKASTSF